MPYLGIFTLEFDRKVWCKKISLNLGPKMPDLRIFGLEFENDIVIFEMSTFEFA